MTNPLVSRPPYGTGRPAMPVGESKLPQGGPTDKGLPVDPGIPGGATFAKPVDDKREDRKDDEPIKRVDGPDDLTKDRDRVDTREDNADHHDGIGFGAPGPQDTSKTKYPYRDGIPNTHNAVSKLGSLMISTRVALRFQAVKDPSIAGKVREILEALKSLQGKLDKACDGLNEDLRQIERWTKETSSFAVRSSLTPLRNAIQETLEMAYPFVGKLKGVQNMGVMEFKTAALRFDDVAKDELKRIGVTKDALSRFVKRADVIADIYREVESLARTENLGGGKFVRGLKALAKAMSVGYTPGGHIKQAVVTLERAL